MAETMLYRIPHVRGGEPLVQIEADFWRLYSPRAWG